jgi:putative acetyltransferase
MRAALPDDLGLIVRLLDEAFAPSRYESHLVSALVEHKRPIHHWVVEDASGLHAYVAFTRAFRDREVIGFHLAPVAVRPDRQRMGYGADLIRRTLRTPPIAKSPVFVLGDPGYHRRFGFERVPQPECPFDPGSAHFMALNYNVSDAFTIG